jgi:hypothetical protein
MKESAIQFAKENSLIFLDESSALADINVKEVVETLLESVFRVQSELLKKGMKKLSSLKVSYEEELMKDAHRCCY